MEPYFYNAHAHIFTIDHVPDEFAKGYVSLFGRTIKISWLRKKGIIEWLVRKVPMLFKKDDDIMERLINVVKYGTGKDGKGTTTQEKIFNTMQNFYPLGTRFIVLPMDMEYIDAGVVPEDYSEQISQLRDLKVSYKELIYPFIFGHPERFERDASYQGRFELALKSEGFAGIKMYPALGYWPFDSRLEQVYDFAVEHNIPIMTHCVRGVVHDRGPKRFEKHPIKTSADLPGKKSKEYTVHYTHPINFHCLLDADIISDHWGKKKDYSKLKVCLAHFGGAEEWGKYLNNPWVADEDDTSGADTFDPLEMDHWDFDLETKAGQYSWYSVIIAMIRKHENLYADVSFMLYDRDTWPLLQLLLTTDQKIKERVLFGTDFYVVAQKDTERALSIGLRSFLGEDLFFQISKTNVEAYLTTDFQTF